MTDPDWLQKARTSVAAGRHLHQGGLIEDAGYRLALEDERLGRARAVFLAEAYELKATADYDGVALVSPERALDALEMAADVVACIEALVAPPASG